MIKREFFLKRIRDALKYNRIACLFGPRQCGKTTIAKSIQKEYPSVYYFDLESIEDIALLDNPSLTLANLTGLIVIDEIQRKPDLMPYLNSLYKRNLDQKFLILGSASKGLMRQICQTLTGPITFIEITPFSLNEVDDSTRLWIHGGFPNSYLSDGDKKKKWLRDYIRTYVEFDLVFPEFRDRTDTLREFWKILAHYHGQISNYSLLAGAFNLDIVTVKKYISYLEASCLIRVLHPWHTNIKKQIIKNPKIYYRDSGLLNHLLKIETYEDVLKNAKAGASFEGFAIEEIIKVHSAEASDCYFFSSDDGSELDLFILDDKKKLGFEFKMSNAPKITASMINAIKELGLDLLTVICPSSKGYMLSENIKVISLKEYIEEQSKFLL